MATHTITVTRADTLSKKAKGLLFSPEAYPLLIKTRWGIHTIGLAFPIDVIVLGRGKMVVKLKPGLKSWRVFTWDPRYSEVLELPAGTLERMAVQIGDTLILTPKRKRPRTGASC